MQPIRNEFLLQFISSPNGDNFYLDHLGRVVRLIKDADYGNDSDNDDRFEIMVVATSFLEFLENFTKDLSTGRFRVDRKIGLRIGLGHFYQDSDSTIADKHRFAALSRFPCYIGPLVFDDSNEMSDETHPVDKYGASICVSHSIVAEASPLFIPSESTTRRYLFSYRITLWHISNFRRTTTNGNKEDEEENKAFLSRVNNIPLSESDSTLLSRYWEIIDDSVDDVDVVQGPGVIGFYPRLSLSSSAAAAAASSSSNMNQHDGDDDEEERIQNDGDFSYESCCMLRGASGSMQGHFVFRSHTVSDCEFKVLLRPFRFDALRSV